MSPLQVLLADDEQLARQRLRRLLGGIEGVELVGECERGDQVVERVRAGGIEVLILDIEMPGLTGLEAVGLLGERCPYVIFSTAHAEHAVTAFAIGAIDYLLKPVEAGRLQQAIERARRWCATRPGSSATAAVPERTPAPRLAVETQEGVVLLDPAEISHAELDGVLVTIHVAGRKVLTDLSLNTLEARLPQGIFVRVHRRALLSLDHVALLEPVASGGYVARTTSGHEIEVSRQAARELRRKLGLGRGGRDEE